MVLDRDIYMKPTSQSFWFHWLDRNAIHVHLNVPIKQLKSAISFFVFFSFSFFLSFLGKKTLILLTVDVTALLLFRVLFFSFLFITLFFIFFFSILFSFLFFSFLFFLFFSFFFHKKADLSCFMAAIKYLLIGNIGPSNTKHVVATATLRNV